MVSNEALSPVIAEFNGVSFHYKVGTEVLKDIHLTLAPGSFHFLTGESGAGKTSLLGLLYLDHLPTKGRVRLFGQTVDSLSRSAKAQIRRQIGVVFQDYRLLDHLTAFDNVALPLRIIGEKESEIKKHVTELLTWVGLEKQMRAHPNELSGGEQQRIAIARAVIHKPSLLLADEPTGNVDDTMAKRLLHLFLELNKLGTTVVVATHNENLIKSFSFPQLHLNAGQIQLIPPKTSYTEIATKLFSKGDKNVQA